MTSRTEKELVDLLKRLVINQEKIIEQNTDIYDQLVYMYQEWYEGNTAENEEKRFKKRYEGS